MPPELAVQVVNFRTKEFLGPCLESTAAALREAGVASRVLVLENGSGDVLGALPGAPEVVVSEKNLGFGGGHNLLATRHDAALICCLNPDVVCDRPDVFCHLLDVLADGEVAATGPLLRTPDGAPQRFDHGELRGLRAVVANGAGHAHWQPRSERLDVAWVSGAFLLVRRTAFAAVGGFDEGFFLYKEEEDLCLRLRQAGGRVVYAPDASATHVGSVVARRDPGLLAAADARYRSKHAAGPRGALLRALHTHVTRRL